jgi:uncharacterized caspase-like protein
MPAYNNKSMNLLWLVLLTVSFIGCSSKPSALVQPEKQSNGSELFVVDCLLPGQIRRLGRISSYLTPRRPIKTSAEDCEIRGGEYVSYDRADYKTALSIWLPQAQQNNPEAQTYVGEIYEKGYGLAPDYGLAAHWYQKAAAQGNSRAQINLGYLYEKGLGVGQDLVAALNWYRKASGLGNDEIGFASTIELAVKAEYEDELNVLRGELDNSQLEITRLQSELDNTRTSYHREQQKLTTLKTKLQNTNTQLAQIKHAATPSSSSDITKYEHKLEADAAKVNQQLKIVEQLKINLKEHNNVLAAKLKQAEQRSTQLSEELVKHQQQEGLLKAKLVKLQTQLARSDLSIAELTDSLNAEQQKIAEEKQQLILLKAQIGTSNSAELRKLKAHLALQEKELLTRQQEITRLEKEKTQLTQEKNALSADRNKTLAEKDLALASLNSKLLQQNQNLEKERARIAQLEIQKQQAISAKKTLEENKNQDNSATNSHIKELENQLSLHEQSFAKQRSQIQTLEKEKQEYEQKISLLQAEKKQKPAYAKPSIEILDPPFTVTRSKQIPIFKLRSVMTHREITGRVTANAGLLSFNVNGLNTDINPSGLFKSLVELEDKETLVRTVAIDKTGNKAELEFMLLSTGQKTAPVKKTAPPPLNPSLAVDFGPYHALIIGNQEYQHFPNLDTPVNDARTVDKILREKYAFKTTLLLNANRYEILSALNKLRAKLTEVDNLLIYYAGHGELDRINLRGHWLPVDAEENNTANWISTIAITDILNAMSAKHVLVVADSCYSGAMTRTAIARLEAGMTDQLRFKWLKLMSKTRSRTALTSGGLKPVLDSGMNGHSIFANAFIEAIANNNQILEGQSLYRKVYDHLAKATKRLNFKQKPKYAPIKHGGHEAGDFFLVAKRDH